ELSRAVRATAVDERHLAELLARAVTTQVGDSAQVWIQPFEGGVPACLAAVPGAVPHDAELLAAVLESGLPAVVEDVAILPLAGGTGGVLGVLVAQRAAGYSPDDVGYLTALADTAAATLDSARLLTDSAMAAEGLRRQSEWLDQVSDAIIPCGADHQVM